MVVKNTLEFINLFCSSLNFLLLYVNKKELICDLTVNLKHINCIIQNKNWIKSLNLEFLVRLIQLPWINFAGMDLRVINFVTPTPPNEDNLLDPIYFIHKQASALPENNINIKLLLWWNPYIFCILLCSTFPGKTLRQR